MNSIPGRLIEPAFFFPSAACERQAAREASPRLGTDGRRQAADQQIAMARPCPFALRGLPETVPQIAGDMNLERRADAKAPGK